MKTLIVWALVVANVSLGTALLAKVGKENTAVAQVGRPADYLMITGEVIGNSNSVMYLLDTTNGRLGAMVFDPTSNRFNLMSPVDLNRIFDAAASGGAPAGGNNRPRR